MGGSIFGKILITKNPKPDPNPSCQTRTRPEPEEIFQNPTRPEPEKNFKTRTRPEPDIWQPDPSLGEGGWDCRDKYEV